MQIFIPGGNMFRFITLLIFLSVSLQAFDQQEEKNVLICFEPKSQLKLSFDFPNTISNPERILKSRYYISHMIQINNLGRVDQILEEAIPVDYRVTVTTAGKPIEERVSFLSLDLGRSGQIDVSFKEVSEDNYSQAVITSNHRLLYFPNGIEVRCSSHFHLVPKPSSTGSN